MRGGQVLLKAVCVNLITVAIPWIPSRCFTIAVTKDLKEEFWFLIGIEFQVAFKMS